MLNQYDYKIESQTSNKQGNADSLSRLPIGPDSVFDKLEEFRDKDTFCTIQAISNHIGPSNSEVLKEETKKDTVLSKVIEMIQTGWSGKAGPDLLDFKKIPDSFSFEDGSLLHDARVLIPSIMRSKILEILHIGHFGVKQLKYLSRSAVYWPGLASDIERMCRNCVDCDMFRNRLPTPVTHPWEPEIK